MASPLDLAGYMEDYMMRGQHTPDRSMTRYRHDLCKMIENNEISTGPGRYVLGVPNAYGNAAYIPNPTILNQKWGAAHDMSSTKTDVESDLRNLARPTARTVCGQYQPDQGQRTLTAMPEADFPRTYERLVDPPCTMRGTGVNRWEWLCQNPQENVMIPFEWGVNSTLAQKDGYYAKVTQPLAQSQVARDHQFLCTTLFVDPAVPVPRAQRPGAPADFTDGMPGMGASRPVQSDGTAPPAAKSSTAGYGVPQQGIGNKLAPPTGAPSNQLDHLRAEKGILVAPTPFPAFIAPH